MDYRIDLKEMDRLVMSMKEFQGDTEKVVSDALWESSTLIGESIQRLMPQSRRTWRGRKTTPAKSTDIAKTLKGLKGFLALTVMTQKRYQYLYFPDDGENTERHYGNQHFFQRGGEAVSDEVVNRCVAKLVNDFQEKIN